MDSTTSRDDKPRLDEATFQKLLAAAYVIQQHQKQSQPTVEQRAGSASADPDYATTLAEIVETQHQIQLQHLDMDGAAAMVVEQVQKITSASGAAVCLLNRDHLVYRAVNGLTVAEIGQAIPRSQSISGPVLAQGAVLRCPDTLADAQVDPMLVGRARIASFIAVPIFHEDQIAGALELTFSTAHAYREHDVRTCQLMAGLITEVLARTAENQWKKNLTAERDSMLEALEKLKPQLDRLAREADLMGGHSASARSQQLPARDPQTARPPMRESVIKPIPNASVLKNEGSLAGGGAERCHRCGHHISAQEVYCGNCGSLRADRARGDTLQRKSPGTWDPAAQPSDLPLSSGPNTLANSNARPSFASNLVDKELQLPSEILALTKNEHEPELGPDLGAELLKLLPPDPDGPGIVLPIEQAHLRSAEDSAPTLELTSAQTALNPPRPVLDGTPRVPLQVEPAESFFTDGQTDALAEEQPAPAEIIPSAAASPPQAYPWTSAANARQWLNSIADPRTTEGFAGFLRTHRGDLSLGAAIVALLLVLVWGMSNHKASPVRPPAPPTTESTGPTTTAAGSAAPTPAVPTNRPRHKAADSQPDLSISERALVALGLAEAPQQTTTYTGNPEVKVWVDLRTALYYCPGADLYGRTPKGKYMTQREAQLDQFEAASRKVCE